MPVCAYEHCDNEFPAGEGRKYCGTSCRSMAWRSRQPKTSKPRKSSGRPPTVKPGDVYGLLVVIELHHTDPVGGRCWLCNCSCGAQRVVRTKDLRNGKVRKCHYSHPMRRASVYTGLMPFG
jgi:hypothetical protein